MPAATPRSRQDVLVDVLQSYAVAKYPGVMAFLRAHIDDTGRLLAMAESAGQDGFLFGEAGLPAIERFLDDRTWPGLLAVVERCLHDLSYNGFRLSWTEFCYQLRLFRKVLPEEYIRSMLAMVFETEAYRFFSPGELVKFFVFAEEVVKLVKAKGIRIIYAIDKSGRILGFLIHAVLRALGMSGAVKSYFLNYRRGAGVQFYDARQKAELRGAAVLVIDEYAASGDTLVQVSAAIDELGGRPFVFAFAAQSPRDTNSVSSLLPSWYGSEKYAGVMETVHGLVEVDKGSAAIARAVRNSLAELAPIIAEYVRVRLG
jgi:adenine/guanine phosphoribosyltransferase-like PRPP-binding protein